MFEWKPLTNKTIERQAWENSELWNQAKQCSKLATNDDPCHTDTSSNHTRCITARALRTPRGHQLNMYFLQIHDCLILKDYLCRQIITIWSSLLQIKPFFVVTRAPRTRTYYTYYPHHSLQQTGSWAGTSLPVSHWSGSWNCQECFLPVASGLGNLTSASPAMVKRKYIVTIMTLLQAAEILPRSECSLCRYNCRV